MPTYAKLLVSVNGGGNQSGGVTVTSGDTLDFSIEDTSGVTSQLFEIYDYPVGFPQPAGWSVDADGVYYYDTNFTPPTVTTSTWGKLMCRLTVNNSLKDGAYDATLVDEGTAISVPSASGFVDIGATETNQFNTSWVKEWQIDLRLMAAGGLSAPANPGDDDKLAFASSGLLDYADGVKVLNPGAAQDGLELTEIDSPAATDLTLKGTGGEVKIDCAGAAIRAQFSNTASRGLEIYKGGGTGEWVALDYDLLSFATDGSAGSVDIGFTTAHSTGVGSKLNFIGQDAKAGTGTNGGDITALPGKGNGAGFTGKFDVNIDSGVGGVRTLSIGEDGSDVYIGLGQGTLANAGTIRSPQTFSFKRADGVGGAENVLTEAGGVLSMGDATGANPNTAVSIYSTGGTRVYQTTSDYTQINVNQLTFNTDLATSIVRSINSGGAGSDTSIIGQAAKVGSAAAGGDTLIKGGAPDGAGLRGSTKLYAGTDLLGVTVAEDTGVVYAGIGSGTLPGTGTVRLIQEGSIKSRTNTPADCLMISTYEDDLLVGDATAHDITKIRAATTVRTYKGSSETAQIGSDGSGVYVELGTNALAARICRPVHGAGAGLDTSVIGQAGAAGANNGGDTIIQGGADGGAGTDGGVKLKDGAANLLVDVDPSSTRVTIGAVSIWDIHLDLDSGGAGNGNLSIGDTFCANWRGMQEGIFLGDCTAAPGGGNPANGGFMFSNAGAGTWHGSGGTVTAFGPAEPHCPRCHRDAVHHSYNKGRGDRSRCDADDDPDDWGLTFCWHCLLDALTDAGIDPERYVIKQRRGARDEIKAGRRVSRRAKK